MKGWIKNVVARSPIWGDVDLKAFCRLTGYSREHATRELSRIRAEKEFAFETKLRSKRGGTKKWGVIVADPEKLRFDKHSLFFDRRGGRLHNYTTLGDGGSKIEPTITPLKSQSRRGRPRKVHPVRPVPKSPRGRPRKNPLAGSPAVQAQTPDSMIISLQQELSSEPFEKSVKNTGLCDVPQIERIPKRNTAVDAYGAERVFVLERFLQNTPDASRPASALRKKAFVIADLLASCHWDNCKVLFNRRTAFCYSLDSLADGHDHERIVSCYKSALFVCHGFAVDLAASTGQIRSFNLSSTVVKARRLLDEDGLTRSERIAQWYRRHFRPEAEALPPNVDPDEQARIHAQIAASFPDDAERKIEPNRPSVLMEPKSATAESPDFEVQGDDLRFGPQEPPKPNGSLIEPTERPATDEERARIVVRVRRMVLELKAKLGRSE